MRLYRALLRLYPAGFRAEYGDELNRTFVERRRRADGAGEVVRLWLRELLDLPRSAALVQLDVLRQDLRFAARSLRRAPGFTATAVLVTALGIGANSAVFSVTDQVMLRPLPYPEPDRLVRLWQSGADFSRGEATPPNFRDWRERSRSFSGMAAHHPLGTNLVGAGTPVRLEGVGVTADLLPLIGVQPLLGRLFHADDDRTGAPGTMVLSYGTWRSVFAADPNVVGRSVRLDDHPYTVIGVMPAGFAYPSRDTQVWTPIRMSEEDLQDRTNSFFTVVARLRPGVSLAAAQSEMTAIAGGLEREHPEENAEIGVVVEPLRTVRRQARLLLLALVGASVCLLVIACLNLATLLSARALARRKELAVRAALGAGRERVARQLLTEALLLTTVGGLLGVMLAAALSPVLVHLVPSELPIVPDLGMDGRLLAFAFLATMLTAAAFGIAPALAAGGRRLEGLHERGALGGARPQTRAVLVTVQVAACLVLLVTCGLLLRALLQVQSTDPGFDADGVLAVQTPLPPERYATAGPRIAFYSRVLEDVRALPGVRAAGYMTFLPLVMGGGIQVVEVAGEVRDPASRPMASLRFVSPDYFTTMGIRRLAGRDFAAADTSDAARVAVVSESFVRRHFPSVPPLGRTFGFAEDQRTIVGVVGDVMVRGLERTSEPQVYLPYMQAPEEGMNNYFPRELVVRAEGDPLALVPAIRRIVERADPEVPIGAVRLMEDVLDAQTGSRRTQVYLLAGYAALALLLAGVGIHGLLSLAVSQRLPELGLRLAIGAGRGEVLQLALAQGLRVAALGSAVGLVLAYMAGRALSGLLAGVAPGDLFTFGGATVTAALLTLSGTLAPALAVVRVDPARVLLSQ